MVSTPGRSAGHDSMVGRTVSHYKILSKVGQGSVGVVYRAEDLRLRRVVALKFLGPHSEGDERRARGFIQEARTAAILDHPNICTVYDIDRAAERIFISMALVEGVNLRERIHAAGRLGVEESMKIAIQVARGLEAAHERGIVHRDIKSANIMITDDGRVRITDFGVASSVAAISRRGRCRGEQAKLPDDAAVTQTNLFVGTPAYMSPEQARGEITDRRTDLWSLGVVIYEMLAGQLPFGGENISDMIHSILHHEIRPLSEVRPEVPQTLDRVVIRALAKDSRERYGDASEMLADLLAEVLSSNAEVPPAVPEPSIAVLPFTDMSPQRDQQYFCDGITEEITNALAHVAGLGVASRTSAFAFKDRPTDVREIGVALGVSTILEGSVRKAGSRLRVTCQLIAAADGRHRWSEQYDRQLEDVFAIQSDIASQIAGEMRMELSESARRVLAKAPTQAYEAYDYYLRGRQLFYRTNRENVSAALEMFTRATLVDRSYALAYAGIADCHAYRHSYFGKEPDDCERAESASRRALELDPQLAEAHASRGLALSLSGRYAQAESRFEAALLLNPRLFEAHYFYGRVCFVQGKVEQAAEHFRSAGRVDPDNFQAASMLGFVYRKLGLLDEARAELRRSQALLDNYLKLNPGDPRATYLKAQNLVDLGRREEGLSWARRVLELAPGDSYNVYGVACLYAQAGDIEKAVECFARAVEAGFAHDAWIETDIDLDPIRDHPRYREVMQRLRARPDQTTKR